MLLYEVTLEVDPAVAHVVEEHMRRVHIPEILATGCFHRIRFDQAPPARFRTSYEARAEVDLERYLREHAPRFRAEFQAHFPTDVSATREIWTPLESWG